MDQETKNYQLAHRFRTAINAIEDTYGDVIMNKKQPALGAKGEISLIDQHVDIEVIDYVFKVLDSLEFTSDDINVYLKPLNV